MTLKKYTTIVSYFEFSEIHKYFKIKKSGRYDLY